MFKQVSLLTRRPDLSVEAFEAYYENNHSRILEELMPDARRYLRRYVRHERNPFGGDARVPFDCVTELWCASREEFAACASSLSDPAAYQRLYRDEENLFASHDNPLFSVAEVESDLPGHDADSARDAFKIVFIVRRNPELDTQQFRHLYEEQYRPLEEKAFAGAIKYVRRYVQTEINPVIGQPIEIPFDAMVEVWWNTRSDWEAANNLVVESELGSAIREAQGKLFSLQESPVFSVIEQESAMRLR